MGPRPGSLFTLSLIASVLVAELAQAQRDPPPHIVPSLELLVGEADVVVRGVVADTSTEAMKDGSLWCTITLDVRETFKGEDSKRLKFAVHVHNAEAALDQWDNPAKEWLWFLERAKSSSGTRSDEQSDPGKTELRLRSWLRDKRVVGLGHCSAEGKNKLPTPLTFYADLRIAESTGELLKVTRAIVAEQRGRKTAVSHQIDLPAAIMERSGRRSKNNILVVPVDGRLESLALRLIESPGDFLSEDHGDQKNHLRLEGIKALRRFQSEKNLAILRSWLYERLPETKKQADRKPTLPRDLTQVPELFIRQPLDKSVKVADAQLHTAVAMDIIRFANQKKQDAFMETLVNKRADLAGLSFAMGDACRMPEERQGEFAASLENLRSAKEKATHLAMMAHPWSTARPAEVDRGFMGEYEKIAANDDRHKSKVASPRIASLMQVIGAESAEARVGLIGYLSGLADVEATRALAKLAIFSDETSVRSAAIRALKRRRDRDYTDILLTGLNYPWPAVAERTSEAIAELGRSDLIPQLTAVLERPDPRLPQVREVDGKKVSVVRELVRINHHHNCLLCHAPTIPHPDREKAEARFQKVKAMHDSVQSFVSLETNPEKKQENVTKLKDLAKDLDRLKIERDGALLTAQVPVPSESLVAYYSPNVPDILVRFDVTYLRQDFSVMLPVADADPWPKMQRFDFVVRTRVVTEEEAIAYRDLLQPGQQSPYHRAALATLRQLRGHVAGSTVAAGLQEVKR